MQPEVSDRFEIRKRLGAGSFGVVYEAFDHHRNRLVALKALEHVAADTITRFKREFRFLSEVRHPNLASMYELVVVADRWLLTMELVEGNDLLEYLACAELQHAFLETSRTPTLRVSDGGLSQHGIAERTPVSGLSDIYLAHVRDCFRQLATGLAALHAHGIVHRDVKPSNIMITAEGRVVLLDFGLVIEIELDDTIDRKTVVGTPGYMSPEQMTAAAATAASDWYSFGALLYQALTGNLPFTGQNPLEIMQNQVRGEVRPAGEVVPGTPADLDELCRDLLRPDASQRPSDRDVLTRLGVSEFALRHEERSHIRTAKLIGRSRDLAALRRELDRTEPGSPRIVTLHGSPGVGKTTVADSFLDEVREQHHAFVIGARCHAWESVPLNAIDAMVDSLARHIRHHHPPAVEEAIARSVSMTRLFPVLDTQPSSGRDDETIFIPSGDKLITRGASELISILCLAAGDHPLVMFLDDAQWGDFLSARVVSRMVEQAQAGCRMMIVLGYRSEDWKTSLFLEYLLGAHPPSREIELKKFARVSGRKIAAAALPEAPPAVHQRIATAADGNPTLIELIAQWPGTVHSRPKDPLLAFALDYGLDGLSSAARAVFELLLVADHPLEESVVAGTLELFEIDEPLRTLSRARLIRSRITGDLVEVDVYHPRMRSAVNDLVSQRRQAELRERLR